MSKTKSIVDQLKEADEQQNTSPHSIIPQQLHFQKFIKTIGKVPMETEWNTVNNYAATDKSFNKYLTKSNIYGVLTGYNNLLVIDCDNEDTQKSLEQMDMFKDTFTVKSAGKGLSHFYFYTDIPPKSFKLTDANKKTLLDGQGIGKQVIGPNSKLDNGRMYEIINTADIKIITYSEIKKIIDSLDQNSIVITEQDKNEDKVDFVEKDEALKQIKEKIKIKDILKEINIDTNKNPTGCPFHGSVGGKCFSYTDTLYHCFHCLDQGNVFQLYQKVKKCDFIAAKEELADKAGVPLFDKDDVSSQVRLRIKQKKQDLATELMVTEFLRTNSIFTIKNDEKPEMWIYDDGIYKPNGRAHIAEFARTMLGDMLKSNLLSNVILKIETDTYIEQKDFFINEDINLIPIANGIFNWKTRELKEFSPEYKFFSKMPAVYNPTIDCPQIKKFFKDILVDKNDINVIQELFGYVLYRDYRYEKAFMFLGSGRNGKGKTLELMKLFIGAENCENLSLQKLETDNFAMSSLFGKSANLSADISKTALHETGNFKSLTGHDLITAPRKFLTPISFVNHAKMIFLANELPQTYDNSVGFFDRWIMIDFKYRFHAQAQFELLEEKTEFDKLADTEMIQKLTTPEEMSGLLNWSLEGLDRLLKQNCFSFSTSTADIKHKWKLRSSTFLTFFEEEIEKDDSGFIPKDDLRQAYSKYCNEHQVTCESDRAIAFKLSDLGITDRQLLVNGLTTRVWMYIKLKNPVVRSVDPDSVKFG